MLSISNRLKNKLPTWVEYFPDLSLEVVKDGHFSELELIKGTSLEQSIGMEKEFVINDILTIPANQKIIKFPLISGLTNGNPILAAYVSKPVYSDDEVRLEKFKYQTDLTFLDDFSKGVDNLFPSNFFEVYGILDSEGLFHIYGVDFDPDISDLDLDGSDFILKKIISELSGINLKLPDLEEDKIRETVFLKKMLQPLI